MKRFFISQLFFLYFPTFFSACSSDDTPEPEVKDYQLLKSLSIENISGYLSFTGQSQWISQIQYPVDIYTYQYPMEYQGKEITASGVICVPVTNGKTFPVISFQHGTLVAKNEAPTLTSNSIFNSIIATMSSFGYVLIIPDLVGFGASSEYFHPYLVKESNVTAVTAMLQGLKNISDEQLSGSTTNDSLFLAGYSQGGWITLAAMEQMEKVNSNGWNLIGTACGAGPYNPEQLMDYVLKQETYPKPFFLAYVLLSFIEDGSITQDISQYINSPYAANIFDLFDGTLNGEAIDAQLTTNIHDLFQPGLFNYQQNNEYAELVASFNKNKVEAWQNQSPLLLMHGEIDTYIPIAISDSIYHQFVSLGSDQVQYESFAGKDHNSAVIPTFSRTLEWFQSLRQQTSTPMVAK